MTDKLPPDDLLSRLPLPLAQLYRRALNAKTPLDTHHHAYYLAEATVKLAACARIGVALAAGIEPRSPLAQSLEALCMPSIGHWVGFLRDGSEYLKSRPDAALLPLADTSERLLQNQTLPAVRAFAQRVSRASGDDEPPLTPEQVRDPVKHGILGFFNLVAAYRNQVFGHGAHRPSGYYEEVGPLLLEAVLAVLRLPELFGGLLLAVARLEVAPSRQEAVVAWHGLNGPVSLPLPAGAAGAEPTASRAIPGQMYFVAPGIRVELHPLAVYHEDKSGRERVGFLNRVITRRRRGNAAEGEGEEVRRCEYLDYATGDPLREIDARQELARLLSRLRGREVTPSEMELLIAHSAAEASDAELAPPAAAGAVIGDFELQGELGRGGMGVVYKARQRSLGRLVALKVLPPALSADAVALTRFRRETAALARCDHPNLVKILTSGSDGDRHYYAMELVEGSDLADLFAVLSAWGKEGPAALRQGHLSAAIASSCDLAQLRRNAQAAQLANDDPSGRQLPSAPRASPPNIPAGPALASRLGELFADVAEALAHLHERGVLHRDIKPGNLMLTADGRRLVLMDLGLARLQDETRDRLTRTRQFLGTLRYASPEQVLSASSMDARSDVYSLGASLWELLALGPLYGAGDALSDVELIRRIQFDDPGRIRKYRKEVPEELEAIVLQCLEKDPRRRYGSARELADDLGRWRRGEQVHARRLTLAYRARKFVGRRARRLVVAGFLLVAVIFGYWMLADAGYQVPAGEGIRQLLDSREASLFRPVPDEAAIQREAADLRVSLSRKLLNSCTASGWWSAALRPTASDKANFDAWTQGQTTTAILVCPETDQATRNLLRGSLLELFAGGNGRVHPFEPGYGWQLFRVTTTAKPYPAGIGTAWVLPAMARALTHLEEIKPDQRQALEQSLTVLQGALDNYLAIESGRPVGGWKLYVDQEDQARPNIYVTVTMLLGLLELRQAGLSWHGDRQRLQDLLSGTESWLLRQFDGRGWKCTGHSGEMEFNDGLTLWLFALLLRAEAEHGLALPRSILMQIPRHLADCETRPYDYPTSVSLLNFPFSYKGTVYNEEVRVVRYLWHPWAVETASRWLDRCHRIGAARDEIVRTRRVLGHLVIALGPQMGADATVGQTFIPSETVLGLSAVPLPR